MATSAQLASPLNTTNSFVRRQIIYYVLAMQAAALTLMAGIAAVANWSTAAHWYIQAQILFIALALLAWQLIQNENLLAPLKSLGLANWASLLRSVLIIFCGGFIGLAALPDALRWMPGILYTVAVILDGVDGWLARRFKQETVLGARLDTCFDAFGLLVAPIVACWLGALHPSYLLVSAAYYVFQCALQWRRRRGLICHALPASKSRRIWAGLQMILVAIALLPMFTAQFTSHLGFAFMLPLLAGFLRDWYVVAGINSGRSVNRILKNWPSVYPLVLLALRGLVVVSIIYGFSNLNHNGVFQLIIGIMGLLVLIGCASRSAAGTVLLILAAFTASSSIPLSAAQLILLYSAAGVVLLGSGPLSLWR
ncbi:MAG TPA: CDP-alcohol phosphatidyltransferase family protein [Cellvibrionaceae bacterium]